MVAVMRPWTVKAASPRRPGCCPARRLSASGVRRASASEARRLAEGVPEQDVAGQAGWTMARASSGPRCSRMRALRSRSRPCPGRAGYDLLLGRASAEKPRVSASGWAPRVWVAARRCASAPAERASVGRPLDSRASDFRLRTRATRGRGTQRFRRRAGSALPPQRPERRSPSPVQRPSRLLRVPVAAAGDRRGAGRRPVAIAAGASRYAREGTRRETRSR